MKHLEIIEKKCTACGLCVRACPVDAIHVIDHVAVIDYDLCILCGACAGACPEQAITFEIPKAGDSQDLARYRDVWVFCEHRNGILEEVSLELLGEGRKLADLRASKLCGVILGKGVTAAAAGQALEYGADRVLAVDSPALEHFRDDVYASVLFNLIEKYKPEIVLAGATSYGRSFIPRVAAMLKTGLTADCTALSIDDLGNLMQTRPAFGGNIMATILCTKSRPQMATVRAGVMKKPSLRIGTGGVLINETMPESSMSSLLEFVEAFRDTDKGAGLSSAKVVIAGGGGIKNAENFQLIEELAEVLGGAVAGSRTAVDRGWIKYSRQIGQTGKTVCPKLYIAVGISGAIQHLVGMQTSEKILSINSDPHAPIFRISDWGLVGDLFEILPALTAKFRNWL
jgi:electron transfer flavoprotein alpha subunit